MTPFIVRVISSRLNVPQMLVRFLKLFDRRQKVDVPRHTRKQQPS